MNAFHCTCGNILFFESSRCLRCGLDVGFDPIQNTMRVLDSSLKLCANGVHHAVCNWLLSSTSSEALCASCRLNRTIPDLSSERNRQHWSLMEAAKRRLLYTLNALHIPLRTLAEDPQNGLAFDIVSTTLNPAATTGHLRGVITVSLEEADDTWRQINRQQLGEASRTLLGHFRHESGHYLWYRYLSPLNWEDPTRIAFREVFGNDSYDYSHALALYYQHGPPAYWQQNYISAYAASHPWEDWAETWSHYLQMIDGFETCDHLGIRGGGINLPLVILPLESCVLPSCLSNGISSEDADFHAWLQRWICLAAILNEISRSFGAPFLYPYVISPAVAQKLRLVHHFANIWR